MLGFLLFKNSYLNIEGRGQGIFPLLAIFIKFHCGNFVKNCLWTSIGSACYGYQELLTIGVITTF